MAHKKTAPGRAVKAIDKVLHKAGVIGQPGRRGLLRRAGLPRRSVPVEQEPVSAAVSDTPITVSTVLSGQTAQEREKKATRPR